MADAEVKLRMILHWLLVLLPVLDAENRLTLLQWASDNLQGLQGDLTCR